MGSLMERVAGAPISWGVCEVPGWGLWMSAGRILGEMRDLGLQATELGPQGFLPADPRRRAQMLRAYGLVLAGGFVPMVLHDPAHDPLPEADRAMDALGEGTPLVLAAATGLDGYDERPDLGTKNWVTLMANLDAVAARATERGHVAALHPHMGTVVQGRQEVERVLDGSGVPLCLDTGHLFIGGADLQFLARTVPDRIAHVHLKDVDADLAARVRDGALTYTEGVRSGMYRPLGHGAIDIARLVATLEDAGYEGWYVMEQDTIIDTEPPAGAGPAVEVEAGLRLLREVADGLR
ncbi:2-keto-myo-inositol dehydratase [Thermomonospora echinospora]|uniref:2-keto-myo-inositol dehydratase n=1 Tax=Thermomonospora echinospora TaxID=1992 RepID=A0A1H5X642_9ACTN|nr:TIM barrel protein [Thermomonospora echinospora]SEG06850.1 2-keto-myo-inositol dehydratase [Thermomonospora echinospora]